MEKLCIANMLAIHLNSKNESAGSSETFAFLFLQEHGAECHCPNISG